MIIEGCENLVGLDISNFRSVTFRHCSGLRKVSGKVAGGLRIEGCATLDELDLIFPRSPLPAPALALRHCPSLRAVGRTGIRRGEIGALTLEDCPALASMPKEYLEELDEACKLYDDYCDPVQGCQVTGLWDACVKACRKSGKCPRELMDGEEPGASAR